MQQVSFHIRGTVPLIMHNARLCDPLNEWTKAVAEISKKRKKTESDLVEMARREFLGSFYTNAKGHPIIPGGNVERMLRDAAAKSKQGKTVQSGLIVTDECPVIYEGPKDPEKMWEEEKFRCRAPCKVGQSRVIRTRPWFLPWELKFEVVFDETILNRESIEDFTTLAGRMLGLGDWRPKHGRFEVVSVN